MYFWTRRDQNINDKLPKEDVVNLSIVIPVLNESFKIHKDIEAACRYIESKGIPGEIIVVDDGSTDTTADVVRETAKNSSIPCILTQLDRNYGKGRTIKTGVLKSQGRFVLVADSGNCVPYVDADIGFEMITSGKCHIAHGSRKLPASRINRSRSLYRKFCSNLFQRFLVFQIKTLARFSDTQCGFKLYDGAVARKLFERSIINGFMFDIEIILLAISSGYTISEFPVHWTPDTDSRLKPIHQSLHIVSDLMTLKKRFAKTRSDRHSS